MTELDVTRIAHSCHLLRFGHAVVLTDPWLTFTATYDPGEAVACAVDELPDLAAVVVTHEHYDHCDLDALAGYRDLTVPLICPGKPWWRRHAGPASLTCGSWRPGTRPPSGTSR